MRLSIDIEDVRAAHARIAAQLSNTPCLHSRTLSQLTGAEIYIKFENLQFTASFKERGALNRLLQLEDAERRRGVCTMSAGNHGQAVAYHAHRLGIPATIVMPRHTPFVKVQHTRSHGATVVLHGDTLAEAFEYSQRIQSEHGLTFVHPYDDPAVMAGQGTIALEMLAAQPDLQQLVVPIGGGGLISGVAVAAKAVTAGIEIIGVQSTSYPSMPAALAGNEALCHGNTIAEGIAVKYAGLKTREVVRALVDDIVLVDESGLERGIALLLNVEKTVAEGAGAASLAAILAQPERSSRPQGGRHPFGRQHRSAAAGLGDHARAGTRAAHRHPAHPDCRSTRRAGARHPRHRRAGRKYSRRIPPPALDQRAGQIGNAGTQLREP